MQNVPGKITTIDPAEKERAANDPNPTPIPDDETHLHPGSDETEQRLLPHDIDAAMQLAHDGQLTPPELAELVSRLGNLIDTYKATNAALCNNNAEIQTALRKTQDAVNYAVTRLLEVRRDLQNAHRWPPSPCTCAELSPAERIIRAEQDDHNRHETMPRPARSLLS